MRIPLRIAGILLFPLVIIYTGIVFLRNKFYDRGWRKPCTVNAPVISVGNIQIGGTGKTPLVEFIAGKLIDKGIPVAVLTRGYRRKSGQDVIAEKAEGLTAQMVGDEPFLLKQNVPGLILGVGKNRCRSARSILSRHPQTVFLLDDGFQHRQMPRNLDIVLIDVSRWSSLPLLFPLTEFRDNPSSLKRADLIVLTRSDMLPGQSRRLRERLEKIYRLPVLEAEVVPKSVVFLNSPKAYPPETIRGKRIAAFCGIAHPEQFFRTIEELGGLICWRKRFPDHHRYGADEVERIALRAKEAGAEWILTTQKDAVKIEEWENDSEIPAGYLKIGMQVSDLKVFDSLIEQAIHHRPQKNT